MNSMTSEHDNLLTGRRILICRPREDAMALAQQLSAQGAACEILPCLQIEPLPLSAEQRQRVLDLDHYDKIIAVSQHAARLALEQIDQYWPQLPVKQQWFAIGRKTARVLAQWPVPGLQCPDQDMTSEQLLAQDALTALEHQRILLLKGEGGRDEIATTLTARGARVDSLALYQRRLPDYSESQLRHALIEFRPDSIIALSAETVVNLYLLARSVGASLDACRLYVPSQRVAEVAMAQGCKLPCVLQNLSADDLLAELSTHRPQA